MHDIYMRTKGGYSFSIFVCVSVRPSDHKQDCNKHTHNVNCAFIKIHGESFSYITNVAKHPLVIHPGLATGTQTHIEPHQPPNRNVQKSKGSADDSRRGKPITDDND